jgi:hypothetical protein
VVIEYTPAHDWRNAGNGSGDAEAQVASFQLLSDSGDPIALSAESAPRAGVYWLTPLIPLQADQSYRMRFERRCEAQAGSADPAWTEQTFRTGRAGAAASSIGSISSIRYELSMLDTPTASGSCTTRISAAIAHIEVALSSELSASLALTRLQAYSEGEPVAELTPNAASEHVVMDVYAGCAVADQGAYGFVTPGAHRVELRAAVAGQTEAPAALWVDIDLMCTPAAISHAADGGCTVSSRRSSGGAVALWLIACLCALSWRRGRRRATQHGRS